MKSFLYSLVIVCLVAIQAANVKPVFGKDIDPAVHKLVNRLIQDGLDKGYLQDLFSRSEFKLVPQAIAQGLVRKEATLNYGQFLEKYSVDRTISYLKTHRTTLDKMERDFGVSAPLVVAILSVETSCGRYMGSFETVEILATQAVSLEPAVYRQIIAYLSAQEKPNPDARKIEKKLKKKSARAYRELKALLAFCKEQNRDPLTVKGSIEGAIGLPQFLPSNIKRYGFDGNGDGTIDLFQHNDAITSVASFLKAHKWREDNGYEQKKKIIRKYNPSDYYADTVLELAELLANYWPQG
ncbi:MAG: lytic murein transglycosylase [Deltaproteobacteria bacterium]|nr:MAG: lytic murein transglycosylase [Deltaproteobacteria bacterium]